MSAIRIFTFGKANPLVLPVLLLVAVMFSLSALAADLAVENKAFAPKKEEKAHFKKICDELNFTPEQKEKLKEIRNAHREKIKPLREKKLIAVKKLREGFKSGATTDTLRAAHKEVGVISSQMSEARFENALLVREILSPDQRVKFDAIRGDMRTHFKDQIRKLVDDEEEPED